MNGNLDTNATYDGTNGVYLATTNDLTKNSAGKALSIAKTAGLAVADGIKPTITKVEAGDTYDGGTTDSTVEKNTFTITFSEAIETSATGDAAILADLAVRKADNTLLSATDLDIVDFDGSNVDGSKVLVVKVNDGVLDLGSNAITVGIPVPRNITDGTNLISEVAAKSVTVSTVAVPVAPTATINYATEALTNVNSTMEVSANGGSTWTSVVGTTYALTPGTNVKVRVAAVDGVSAGAVQDVTVAARQALGTITVGGQTATEAVLVGGVAITTADGYEYTTDGTTWTALTTGKTFNLTGAAVLKVRKAATSSGFASVESADLDI